MESTRWSSNDPVEERMRSELRATLAAYQELGPTYEDQVINSFVDRMQPVLRSRQAVQPQQPMIPSYRRRRDRPHFGLLFLLALLFGWFVLAGSAHPFHRFYAGPGFGGLPIDRPGVTVPNIPQQIPAQIPPQAPSSSVQ